MKWLKDVDPVVKTFGMGAAAIIWLYATFTTIKTTEANQRTREINDAQLLKAIYEVKADVRRGCHD